MYPNKPADKGGRLSGISIFELFIKFRKDLRGFSLSLTNFILFLFGKAVSEKPSLHFQIRSGYIPIAEYLPLFSPPSTDSKRKL